MQIRHPEARLRVLARCRTIAGVRSIGWECFYYSETRIPPYHGLDVVAKERPPIGGSEAPPIVATDASIIVGAGRPRSNLILYIRLRMVDIAISLQITKISNGEVCANTPIILQV